MLFSADYIESVEFHPLNDFLDPVFSQNETSFLVILGVAAAVLDSALDLVPPPTPASLAESFVDEVRPAVEDDPTPPPPGV